FPLFVFLLVTVVAPCAVAQSFNCNTYQTITPSSPTVIMFDPAAPNASQSIVITVGVGHYDPQTAVTALQDTSINITLNAAWIRFATAPPRSCVTTILGPLASGTYQVNLYVNDLIGNVPPPNLQGTTMLTVTPDLSAVPTLSRTGSVVLVMLLSVGALFVF